MTPNPLPLSLIAAAMTKPITAIAALSSGNYLLMIQRADMGDSDASEIRRAFQDAAKS